MLWLLFMLLAQAARAADYRLYSVTQTYGAYTTVMTWNATNASYVPACWLHVGSVGNTAYLLGERVCGQVNVTVCQPSVSTRVVVLGRGCDNVDPAQAVEHANCALDSVAAQANLDLLLQEWYLPWAPGTSTRFGPPDLVGIEYGAAFNDLNLLRAQGVALYSGVGHNCRFPAVTWVDVDLPTLVITSNCTDAAGFAFSGQYKPDRRAHNLDEQFMFARADAKNYQQFFLGRDAGISLKPVLRADALSFWGTAVLQDLAGLQQNQTYIMTRDNITTACVLSAYIQAGTRALQPPPEITSLNYFYNKFPGPKQVTRVCNHHIGALDELGNNVYPGCNGATADHCGGKVLARIGAPPGLLPFIQAQPLYRTGDCREFYPPGDAFQTYSFGANTGPAMFREPDGHVCFAPFLLPAKVAAMPGEDEKFKQCHMRGGMTYGPGRVACQKDKDYNRCLQGWLEMDQHCYYKPDTFRELNFAVPIADAEAICQGIGATAAWIPNEYVAAYIKQEYIVFNPDPSPRPHLPFRITVAPGRCACYDFELVGDLASPVEFDCNCDAPAFPVCRYQLDQHAVLDADVRMAHETRVLAKQGQRGIPHSGDMLQCGCDNGWGALPCTTAVCALPLFPNASDSLTLFSLRYSRRGTCYNGQPRTAVCNPYYGPPASIIPGLPFYEYNAFPCACPGAAGPTEAAFRVDGTVYVDARAMNTPCSGVSAGACTFDAGTNEGRCTCTQRPLLNPDLAIPYGPALNGLSCGCPNPILPPDGYTSGGNIVAGYCNNRGTCCPFGERQDEEIIPGGLTGSVLRCAPGTNGCQCDNGYTGVACTCTAPIDLAAGRATTPSAFFVAVDLGLRQSVGAVRVAYRPLFTTSSCTPLQVGVTDQVLAQPTYCAYNATSANWDCPNAFARWVVVYTLESAASCDVKVYTQLFPPCGFNGNPYAAAFFAQDRLRAPLLYLDPQSIEFAPSGCTTTACMCNEAYAGDHCRYAVSGYRRVDVNGSSVLAQRICAEDLLPPRGLLGDAGCDCQGITSADSTGLSGKLRQYFGDTACAVAYAYEPALDAYRACSGHGLAVQPRFAMGVCAFDQVDLANDPLNTPFYSVASAAEVPPRFSFKQDSVVAIAGQSWLLAEGQEFTIPTLNASFAVCLKSRDASFPLNLTLGCSDAVAPPLPAWALRSVYALAGNYTELCDPAATTGATLCAVTDYCGAPPCVFNETWQALPGSLLQLDVGTYVDTWFPCASARRLDALVLPSIAGTLKCANAVHRAIDHAAQLVTGEALQCPGSITPYSNTIGWPFGLLYNQIPGLSFVDTHMTWTDEHYRAVGSVVNDERWFLGDQPAPERMGSMQDLYLETWLGAVITDESTGPVPAVATSDVAGGTWGFRGALGSFSFDDAYVMHGSTADLLLPNRRGLAAAIPLHASVRQFQINAPFDIDGLQIVTEEGVCATQLGLIPAGSNASLPCVSTPRDLSDLLVFLVYTEHVNVSAALADWPAAATYAIYYNAAGRLNASHITAASRSNAYGTLWDALTHQIVSQHRFPANAPLRAAYLQAGAAPRAIDYAAPADQQYLRDLYYTYFAPRRCSADWQCKGFSAHGAADITCEYPALGYTPWRNGDPAFADGVQGDEGGCACGDRFQDGFWFVRSSSGVATLMRKRDLQSFCVHCQAGYGPEDTQAWVAALDYQRQVLLRIPDYVSRHGAWPLYDPAVFPETGNFTLVESTAFCRWPVFTTTRATTICGGRGSVTKRQWTTPEVLHVYPDAYGNQLTPACTALLLNGTLLLNQNGSLAMQSFAGGGLRLNVVADTAYLRQGNRYLAQPGLALACLHDVPRLLMDAGAQWIKRL
jgi:hypothetical protein